MAQEMGLDEVLPGDRTPRGVGGDRPGRARQEGLRAVGEQLQRPVVVEGLRQRQRLPRAGERAGDVRCHPAHALVERLVVAEAGQPRDGQAVGLELAHGALQQGRVVREAELASVEVGPVRAVTVRFPEEVVRPARRLDALVAGAAGARRAGAAVEQGEEGLQLVPLGVVDGVAGGHRQPQRRPAGRAAQRVDRAQHRVDRVRGERLLRALDGDDLGVPGGRRSSG
jgi:hypothetical protein